MSKEIELYERIDAYLNQELSGKDLQDFQDELVWNNELREQVDLQQLVNENVIDYRLTKVKALAQSYAQKSTPSQIQNYVKGGLVLLAVSGTALYLLFPTTKESHNITVDSLSKDSTATVERSYSTAKDSGENHAFPQSLSSKTLTPSDTAVYKTALAPDTSSALLKKEIPSAFNLPINTTSTQVVSKKELRTENPCAAIILQADVQVKPSCVGKNTGSIIVETISGGNAPYLLALGNEDFTSSRTFEQLSSGNYSLQVKDSKGCISIVQKKYVVESVTCMTSGKYVISPVEGQFWKIPVEGKSAKLKIFNKGGIQIYSMDITNGSPEEWDGRDLHGSYPEPGVYLYLLEFSDGHIEQGYITMEM